MLRWLLLLAATTFGVCWTHGIAPCSFTGPDFSQTCNVIFITVIE